jgi:polysaccharide biosynthesis protein PslG
VPTLTTPVPTPPQPAPASAKPLGFSNGLGPLTHPQRARLLDEAVAIGVRWVRLDIDWWAVEGTQGSPNWQPYKDYLALAKQKGVQVLGLLDNAPPWHCGQAWCAPDPTRFGQFCGDAVRQLGPLGLRYVEVWNEPNITPFFKPRPDAVRYTQMLRSCYDQVKAVDPGIFVVAGGLSPAGGYNDPLCNGGSDPNESADVNPLNFLERMYANGVKDHFDALGWHPYDAAGPTSTHHCGAWNQMSGTTPSARSIMVANGDGSKPIWATEWGVDLAWVGNNETMQATHARDGLNLWKTYPWAGHIFYFWQWAGLGGFDGFSATRADWTKRPIWNELAGHGP